MCFKHMHRQSLGATLEAGGTPNPQSVTGDVIDQNPSIGLSRLSE